MSDDQLPRWARVRSDPDYEVVDADLQDAREIVTGIWGDTIGWPGRQEDVYNSYYLEYPNASPTLKLLRHVPSDEVVGALGIGQRHVQWNGRWIRAGVFSYFCVHPDHRKVQPPMLLVKAAIDACRGSCDVVYGMPRTEKAIAFSKLTGFSRVCDVSRGVRVLRYEHYLQRVVPRIIARVAGAMIDAAASARDAAFDLLCGPVSAEWVGQANSQMEELWRNSCEPSGPWSAARDIAFLRWRFDQLPSSERRYLLLRNRTSRQLIAWLACDTNVRDRGTLVVQDFWGSGPGGRMHRTCIRTLCREVRALGFAAVEIRLSGPDAVMDPWRREHFVERNRYPVFAHWFDSGLASDNAEFRITELDNDG